MPLVRLAKLAQLPQGSLLEATHEGKPIALCNVDGSVRAFQGTCPHLNGPLGQGNLYQGNIICPWHAWEFSAVTGESDYNPAVRLGSYRVEIRDGDVFADIP